MCPKPYNMSIKHDKVIRPTANFPPSVWGDEFLVYDQVYTFFQNFEENRETYRVLIRI